MNAPTATADNALVRAIDVSKHFGSVVALDKVSLSVARGLDPDNPPHLRKVTETT